MCRAKKTEVGMEVNYVLMAEDLKAYLRHIYAHSPQARPIRWLTWVLLALMIFALACVLLLVLFGEPSDQGAAIPFMAIPIGIIVLLCFWPQIIAWRWSKNLTTSDRRKLFSQRRVIIAPNSFDFTSDGSSSSIRWSSIDHIEESEDYTFVFVTSALAHIIPKRVFTSEEEYYDFVAGMRGFLENAKRDAKPQESSEGRNTAAEWKTKTDDAIRPAAFDEHLRPPKAPEAP
jgi:hypothetical protein